MSAVWGGGGGRHQVDIFVTTFSSQQFWLTELRTDRSTKYNTGDNEGKF